MYEKIPLPLVSAHESAKRDLKDYERPLPKIKELSQNLKDGEAANTANYKSLGSKRAEKKRLDTTHTYLYYLNVEHEPKRERQQTRSKGLER